ncbi:DUF2975 domain-containing protein [Alkalihalobacillus trypoxylicola]|uniref:DUF2975 domain-containing protein n=1 Tax=Alkalihalobacillus trypoxylicola TaxID=519424 RepID=A0A161PKW8_9BACI|nr:DUF2975 domain-containing protein [Alkalihalobacillus trypoxylicola]KYG34946.1 hypothetical protein AZF04_01030 [Alkalihalobacillus trypoxylicola]
MEKGKTTFLKMAIIIIGFIVLILCIFFMPSLAKKTAEMFPEYSYLRYPVLIGLYATIPPFYIALYQAVKLLRRIEKNDAFSIKSVKGLRVIKSCAIMISLFYTLGAIFLMIQNAFHPGIALMILTIIFSSFVVAVFSMLLQTLLRNALEIKSENDLTV